MAGHTVGQVEVSEPAVCIHRQDEVLLSKLVAPTPQNGRRPRGFGSLLPGSGMG